MQIHADTIGKVALDYITLWAKVSRKCLFTFSYDSVLCKWEWIFHKELYYVTPATFRHNFRSAGNNCPQCILCTKFDLCSCIRSTDTKGVRHDDPVSLILDLLNPTVEDYSLLLCQVSSHSDQGRVFVLSCQRTHTHTHHDKVIAISTPPYYVVGVKWINIYIAVQRASTLLIQLSGWSVMLYLHCFSVHKFALETAQPYIVTRYGVVWYTRV